MAKKKVDLTQISNMYVPYKFGSGHGEEGLPFRDPGIQKALEEAEGARHDADEAEHERGAAEEVLDRIERERVRFQKERDCLLEAILRHEPEEWLEETAERLYALAQELEDEGAADA